MTVTIAGTHRLTPVSQSIESQDLPDEALVGRIARGDTFAMRSLFGRHQVRIYRFVLRISRDESLAEDCVSDVFLEVWRGAAAYKGRGSVSTWLLAIARNKAISALRRNTEVELNAGAALAIVDPANDPETALRDKDQGEVLRRCLAKLSPEHAATIDLVYYHGKSVKEAADIVGIPESTVKTRMFYARKKLADELTKATRGDVCGYPTMIFKRRGGVKSEPDWRAPPCREIEMKIGEGLKQHYKLPQELPQPLMSLLQRMNDHEGRNDGAASPMAASSFKWVRGGGSPKGLIERADRREPSARQRFQ